MTSHGVQGHSHHHPHPQQQHQQQQQPLYGASTTTGHAIPRTACFTSFISRYPHSVCNASVHFIHHAPPRPFGQGPSMSPRLVCPNETKYRMQQQQQQQQQEMRTSYHPDSQMSCPIVGDTRMSLQPKETASSSSVASSFFNKSYRSVDELTSVMVRHQPLPPPHHHLYPPPSRSPTPHPDQPSVTPVSGAQTPSWYHRGTSSNTPDLLLCDERGDLNRPQPMGSAATTGGMNEKPKHVSFDTVSLVRSNTIGGIEVADVGVGAAPVGGSCADFMNPGLRSASASASLLNRSGPCLQRDSSNERLIMAGFPVQVDIACYKPTCVTSMVDMSHLQHSLGNIPYVISQHHPIGPQSGVIHPNLADYLIQSDPSMDQMVNMPSNVPQSQPAPPQPQPGSLRVVRKTMVKTQATQTEEKTAAHHRKRVKSTPLITSSVPIMKDEETETYDLKEDMMMTMYDDEGDDGDGEDGDGDDDNEHGDPYVNVHSIPAYLTLSPRTRRAVNTNGATSSPRSRLSRSLGHTEGLNPLIAVDPIDDLDGDLEYTVVHRRMSQPPIHRVTGEDMRTSSLVPPSFIPDGSKSLVSEDLNLDTTNLDMTNLGSLGVTSSKDRRFLSRTNSLSDFEFEMMEDEDGNVQPEVDPMMSLDQLNQEGDGDGEDHESSQASRSDLKRRKGSTSNSTGSSTVASISHRSKRSGLEEPIVLDMDIDIEGEEEILQAVLSASGITPLISKKKEQEKDEVKEQEQDQPRKLTIPFRRNSSSSYRQLDESGDEVEEDDLPPPPPVRRQSRGIDVPQPLPPQPPGGDGLPIASTQLMSPSASESSTSSSGDQLVQGSQGTGTVVRRTSHKRLPSEHEYAPVDRKEEEVHPMEKVLPCPPMKSTGSFDSPPIKGTISMVSVTSSSSPSSKAIQSSGGGSTDNELVSLGLGTSEADDLEPEEPEASLDPQESREPHEPTIDGSLEVVDRAMMSFNQTTGYLSSDPEVEAEGSSPKGMRPSEITLSEVTLSEVKLLEAKLSDVKPPSPSSSSCSSCCSSASAADSPSSNGSPSSATARLKSKPVDVEVKVVPKMKPAIAPKPMVTLTRRKSDHDVVQGDGERDGIITRRKSCFPLRKSGEDIEPTDPVDQEVDIEVEQDIEGGSGTSSSLYVTATDRSPSSLHPLKSPNDLTGSGGREGATTSYETASSCVSLISSPPSTDRRKSSASESAGHQMPPGHEQEEVMSPESGTGPQTPDLSSMGESGMRKGSVSGSGSGSGHEMGSPLSESRSSRTYDIGPEECDSETLMDPPTPQLEAASSDPSTAWEPPTVVEAVVTSPASSDSGSKRHHQHPIPSSSPTSSLSSSKILPSGGEGSIPIGIDRTSLELDRTRDTTRDGTGDEGGDEGHSRDNIPSGDVSLPSSSSSSVKPPVPDSGPPPLPSGSESDSDHEGVICGHGHEHGYEDVAAGDAGVDQDKRRIHPQPSTCSSSLMFIDQSTAGVGLQTGSTTCSMVPIPTHEICTISSFTTSELNPVTATTSDHAMSEVTSHDAFDSLDPLTDVKLDTDDGDDGDEDIDDASAFNESGSFVGVGRVTIPPLSSGSPTTMTITTASSLIGPSTSSTSSSTTTGSATGNAVTSIGTNLFSRRTLSGELSTVSEVSEEISNQKTDVSISSTPSSSPTPSSESKGSKSISASWVEDPMTGTMMSKRDGRCVSIGTDDDKDHLIGHGHDDDAQGDDGDGHGDDGSSSSSSHSDGEGDIEGDPESDGSSSPSTSGSFNVNQERNLPSPSPSSQTEGTGDDGDGDLEEMDADASKGHTHGSDGHGDVEIKGDGDDHDKEEERDRVVSLIRLGGGGEEEELGIESSQATERDMAKSEFSLEHQSSQEIDEPESLSMVSANNPTSSLSHPPIKGVIKVSKASLLHQIDQRTQTLHKGKGFLCHRSRSDVMKDPLMAAASVVVPATLKQLIQGKTSSATTSPFREEKEEGDRPDCVTPTPQCPSGRTSSSPRPSYARSLTLDPVSIVGMESDEEDGGIYTDSYMSHNWLYINKKNELEVWRQRLHSVTSSSSINKAAEASVAERDVNALTEGERTFLKAFESLTHRMIHRKATLEMYGKIMLNTFRIEQTIVVNRNNGEFGFRIHGSRPVVVSAIERNTPAESSGLEVGDIIINLNDVNVLDASHSDIVRLAHSGPQNLKIDIVRTRNTLVAGESFPSQARILMSGWMERRLPLSSLTQSQIEAADNIESRRWVLRWYILSSDLCLYWFKSSEDCEPVGVIRLNSFSASLNLDSAREGAFTLTLHHIKNGNPIPVQVMAAKSADLALKWVTTINDASNQLSQMDPFMELSTLISACSAISIKDPDCCGFAGKFSHRNKVWKTRYFVLKDASLFMFEDVTATSAMGVMLLHGYKAQACSMLGKKNTFELIPPQSKLKHFWLMADTEVDKKRWLASLEYSIDRWMKLKSPPPLPSETPSSASTT